MALFYNLAPKSAVCYSLGTPMNVIRAFDGQRMAALKRYKIREILEACQRGQISNPVSPQ